MDGKTHRVIAPVFTAGVVTAYLRTKGLDMQALCTTVGIATASSYLSACWADADQHAKCKPIPVIWMGTSPILDTFLRVRGVRQVRVARSDGAVKRKIIYKGKSYDRVKHFDAKIWATLFRAMGLRAHRDWRSHSPLLWAPIWYYLYYLVMSVPILSTIVMGFGLGYMSHLLSDALTVKGVPFLPNFHIIERIPVVNHFTEVRVLRGSFFKAGNKFWNVIVILIFLDISLYIIAPDFAKQLNGTLLNIVKAFGDFIISTVKVAFS